MKFIHTGDFHIGASHPFSKHSDVMFRRAIAMLSAVKKREVQMLFLTGDLFDRDDVKVSTVDTFFHRLAALDIPVFIVIGNHDMFLRNQAYKRHFTHKNIHTFNQDKRKHTMGDVDVYGFNTHDFDLEVLKTINDTLDKNRINVLCLHGDIMNARDEHYLTSHKTIQAMDFDYVALGHIHKHTAYNHVVYSGNIEPLDFSETEDKGFIEGSLEKPVKFTFHPSQQYRFVQNQLDISEGLDEAVEAYLSTHNSDDAAHTFHRITLIGQRDRVIDPHDAVFDGLKETFGHVEIKDETRPRFDDYKMLKKQYKGTVVEALVDIYEKEGDEDAFALALEALYESGEGFDDY